MRRLAFIVALLIAAPAIAEQVTAESQSLAVLKSPKIEALAAKRAQGTKLNEKEAQVLAEARKDAREIESLQAQSGQDQTQRTAKIHEITARWQKWEQQ